MGCLNSDEDFQHWFGNIHLSGPCNRACYFCIGQFMQSLEQLNNLNVWPLNGIGEFVKQCNEKGVKEVNLTGSNTDPFLYEHFRDLTTFLREKIPNVTLGVRTNGALILSRPDVWAQFDKASISVHSLNPSIYRAMMGKGDPPNLKAIVALDTKKPIKINIVLGPENMDSDLYSTLRHLARIGIKQVNLREPYGQPHIGNPLALEPVTMRYGMPVFIFEGMEVMYWDVHYVEVESINLYANGRVSKTYPITKGYDPEQGSVSGQEKWKSFGRKFAQWGQ